MTYRWYRFIDRPVFGSTIGPTLAQLTKAHRADARHWSIRAPICLSPPRRPHPDTGLLVTPPVGLEFGYVPVVIRQERSRVGDCASPAQRVINRLTEQALVGLYERDPVENGWHTVTVVYEDEQLWWTNAANARWRLSFEDGVLQTQEDCPYGISNIEIVLAQDDNGNF